MNEQNHSTVTDSPEFLLLNEVGIVDQLAQSKAGKLLEPDLNMPQFIVLNHLHRRGAAASMVNLAQAMQVTKGAMSNTVARLQQKEWVQVRADPNDGRGKLIALTAAGLQARSAAVVRLTGGLAGLERVLTAKELATALQLLQKVRVWFDARRD